jgi:hypothetical protein
MATNMATNIATNVIEHRATVLELVDVPIAFFDSF